MRFMRYLVVNFDRPRNHIIGYCNIKHFSKQSGVNLDDPESIDALEENQTYNQVYYQLHQNNGKAFQFTAPKLDINNVDEIEQYENLYFDSYKKHEINEKLKQFENSLKVDTMNRQKKGNQGVLGRIYLGKTVMEEIKSSKVLTIAEVAGVMAAKNTSSLIPNHFNTKIHKVDVVATVDEDNDEVVVEASVQSDDKSSKTESMIACTVALSTIYDFAVNLETTNTSDILIRDIKPYP